MNRAIELLLVYGLAIIVQVAGQLIKKPWTSYANKLHINIY